MQYSHFITISIIRNCYKTQNKYVWFFYFNYYIKVNNICKNILVDKLLTRRLRVESLLYKFEYIVKNSLIQLHNKLVI